jgi:hypothetical protein
VPRRLPLLAALAALALPGCGIGSEDVGPNPEDKRAATLECLREEKGVDARAAGPTGIQVGEPATGPRVRFYLTSGEAEAAQFKGSQEGSEHIGSALLFVREGSDDVLEDVEACLDSL